MQWNSCGSEMEVVGNDKSGIKRMVMNAIPAALCLLVVGCGGTMYSMHGFFEGEQETFSGGFTWHFDDEGNLQFRTTKGRTCIGKIPSIKGNMRASSGQGTITCNDGQTGTFQYTAENMQGNGKGTIGGRPFAFTLTPGPGGI